MGIIVYVTNKDLVCRTFNLSAGNFHKTKPSLPKPNDTLLYICYRNYDNQGMCMTR